MAHRSAPATTHPELFPVRSPAKLKSSVACLCASPQFICCFVKFRDSGRYLTDITPIWDGVRVRALLNRVRIELNTLSMDKDWIGV